MNSFVIKKLGEVLAFCFVEAEILENGRTVLRKTLGTNNFDNYKKNVNGYISEIKLIAKNNDLENAILNEAGVISSKIKELDNKHINELNDSVEMLEWIGLIEGAAIAHWQLILGTGEGLKNNQIEVLATNATELHENILSLVMDHIRAIGRTESAGTK